MESLNLPPADLRITRKGEQLFVWCVVRRKRLVLTPEEWVRQHVIHFLLSCKGVPPGRLASEHTIMINGQPRRADVVVFSATGTPALIVECKAASISIDERTFLQTSNYVQQLRPRYFWMTNGNHHVIADCEHPGTYLNDLPEFS